MLLIKTPLMHIGRPLSCYLRDKSLKTDFAQCKWRFKIWKTVFRYHVNCQCILGNIALCKQSKKLMMTTVKTLNCMISFVGPLTCLFLIKCIDLNLICSIHLQQMITRVFKLVHNTLIIIIKLISNSIICANFDWQSLLQEKSGLESDLTGLKKEVQELKEERDLLLAKVQVSG